MHIATIKDLNNYVIGATIITEDVSCIKQYENELKEARFTAEEALKTKSNFLATMSHEIRTPMNAIIGMAELAMTTSDLTEKNEYISQVKKSTDHLLILVNDILDYSKIESGKLELYTDTVSLKTEIQKIINMFQFAIDEKKLELVIDYDPKIPEYLTADPTRLRQVLINLLSNAVKFTNQGTIMVQVHSQGEIINNKLPIYFAVKDTGCGIDPGDQAIIFEQFRQSHDKSSRKQGGTGLGLTIAQSIVRMMGGELNVHSQVNEGSCFDFTIELPIATDYQENKNYISLPDKKNPPKNRPALLAKWNILLAEDIEVNAKIIKVALSRLGHQVTVAGNGREAIDLLQKEKFDFILMDIEMPEMNGLQATQFIRSGKAGIANKQIPIIALTAHVTHDFKRECLQKGMDGFISKPVNLSEISNIIERILHEKMADIKSNSLT